MLLRNKPLEIVDELKDCFALDAGGAAPKSAAPRLVSGQKGRAVVTTAALLKVFVSWET
jgi:hypothetical protein